MEKKQDERAMLCPVCHNVEYPKISPGIIVAVTNGDQILLTKYAHRTNPHYALIAGFNEVGETLEETVHREVMEEVGLQVKHLRYYKNQPWSFSDSLLVGFFADLDGTPDIHRDASELATAEWRLRKDIPSNTLDISLTHEMIHLFQKGGEPR
jgi:NAD+ diphosphatase